MMIKKLITGLIGLLLSGCTASPPVKFYMLESIASSGLISTENNVQQTIGIGPLSVPSLLSRKQIITRLPDNGIQIAEFDQWASSLDDTLLQTITRNLSILEPNYIVRPYPWSVHGNADIQIIIDFIRFDTTPGKSVNLEANWTIKNETSHKVLKNGHSALTYSFIGSSYADTVHGLSQILSQFCRDLSKALRTTEFNR